MLHLEDAEGNGFGFGAWRPVPPAEPEGPQCVGWGDLRRNTR